MMFIIVILYQKRQSYRYKSVSIMMCLQLVEYTLIDEKQEAQHDLKVNYSS
jgi:hypothetical protein